jgi:hypothetical protein
VTKRPKKPAGKYASVYDPDDGSHTKVRLMECDAVRNPLCMDCGVDTDEINEQYMVLDDIWRKGNPSEAGMLCIGCLEKRLGRELRRNDFPRYAQSLPDEGMPVSDRLRNRIGRR